MHRLIPISLLLASLAACDASQFSTARRADTAEAYRRFLTLSPDSENAPAARQRLEALEYRRVKAADKVIGYRMFLDEYPTGRYAADCTARMARKALARASTPADLQLILEQYPDTPQAATARERLPGALAEETLKAGDEVGMAAFLERFPGHTAGAAVRAALAKARFGQIKERDDRLELEAFARSLAGTPEAAAARERARVLLEDEVASMRTLLLLRELQTRYPRSPKLASATTLVRRHTAALALLELDLKTMARRPEVRLGGVELSRVNAACKARPARCQQLMVLARAARPWRPSGSIKVLRAAVFSEDLVGAWRSVESLGWAPDEAPADLLLELAGSARISTVRLASRALARWIKRGESERAGRWLRRRLRHTPNRSNLDELQRHGLLLLLARKDQGDATLRQLMNTAARTLSAGYLLAAHGGEDGAPRAVLTALARAASARLKSLKDSFPSELNQESGVAATLAERELFSLSRALAEAAGAGSGVSPLAMVQASIADTLVGWQARLTGEVDRFTPAADPDISDQVKRHEQGRAPALRALRRRRDPAGRAMTAALCLVHPTPGCP